MARPISHHLLGTFPRPSFAGREHASHRRVDSLTRRLFLRPSGHRNSLRSLSTVSAPSKECVTRSIIPLQPFFHDGSIITLLHKDNQMKIALESAQLLEKEMKSRLRLSPHQTLKGILHLENIVSLRVNDKPALGTLGMLGDSGSILDFDIDEKTLSIFIRWKNYPPKENIEAYSQMDIQAEKIWWMNIPDLFDPFR